MSIEAQIDYRIGKSLRGWASYVLVLLVATQFAACSHLHAPPLPNEPIVAYLPFQLSGISDGREEFASKLKQELIKEGQNADTTRWLHHLAQISQTKEPDIKTPLNFNVLIIPGIFGDCIDDQSLPFSDGIYRTAPRNYTEGYSHYSAELGKVRAIQVLGRSSSAINSQIIAHELQSIAASESGKPIVLVAYSKGLPDTMLALEALQRQGKLPANLKALISISGVVMGTPLADRYGSLYEHLLSSFAGLNCSKSTGGEISSLSVFERQPWLNDHRLPDTIKLYSVVAHTNRDQISPALRPFYDQLSPMDNKNDGQMIAGWSLLPGSKLLAEVKSDHWTYVLPIAKHPSQLVRTMSSSAEFPREQFFRALIKSVAQDLHLN